MTRIRLNEAKKESRKREVGGETVKTSGKRRRKVRNEKQEKGSRKREAGNRSKIKKKQYTEAGREEEK
jgi:hypothetical protein